METLENYNPKNLDLSLVDHTNMATLLAATGYAIKKKISLFQSLEALNEEIEITFYDQDIDEGDGFISTQDVDVPLVQLMDDVPYGTPLIYFASECLTHITVWVAQRT